ncbi:hypothetical protein OQA88_5564 [Cercophora sp. LCS_1]
MSTRLVVAALVAVVAYLYLKIRHARFEQFKKLPQLKPSFLWGHMKLFDDFIKQGKPDVHADEVFRAMRAQAGNPPILFLDLRPVAWPMLLVASHDIAERVSKASKTAPWSTPKSPTGEEWKHSRKMFNPGFAPSHLLSLLRPILNKTWIFLNHLDSFAGSGEVFSVTSLLINLTFDIIGAVVMDADFDAQHLNKADRGKLIRLYDELVSTYTNVKASTPWWFTPRVTWHRQRLARQIDESIKPMIRAEHARQRQSADAKKSRSVLALSLRGISELTEEDVSEACDQIKTFLFAGHDTTSILLSWVFYELARHPRILKVVRDELDALFGPDSDPASVRDKLLAPGGEDLVSRMPYASAVIKEALRLHPPAGSARMSPPGAGLTVPSESGEEVCVDGFIIYNCATLIQSDKNVYGETADDFMPERWLGNSDTSENTNVETTAGKDGIPAGAWRPFERGPRNCIGQELANVEARVILAVVARRYDFVKVGTGEFEVDEKGRPVLDEEKGQFKVKSEMYSSQQVTAKPVDGMRVRVKLVPGSTALRS